MLISYTVSDSLSCSSVTNGVFLKSSPLLKRYFIIALFIVCLTMVALTSNFCSSSSSFQIDVDVM